MKLVTGDQVIEIGDYKQLRTHIPGETLDSLKRQFKIPDDVFDDYLDKFAMQDRKSTADSLVRDVSTAVPILYWQYERDLPSLHYDAAMFHFLYPEAHVQGGKDSEIFSQAQAAINLAQSTGLHGRGMLSLYNDYMRFLLDNEIDVRCILGAAADAWERTSLAALAEQASRGAVLSDNGRIREALRELPSGQGSFIMSFSYGSHQTYLRVSRNGEIYLLEYFDRQRQALVLKGKQIPGYFNNGVASQAQPIYFTFSINPEELAVICETAQKIAVERSQDDSLGNGHRQRVLETFADKAQDIGVLGETEPAQDPVAINCAWASFESIIRTSLGPRSLQEQVDFMRKVVVNRSIAGGGTPEEKAAVGI